MPILSRSASASALTSAGTASVISPISTSPSPMPAQVAELMRPLPGAAKGGPVRRPPFLFCPKYPGVRGRAPVRRRRPRLLRHLGGDALDEEVHLRQLFVGRHLPLGQPVAAVRLLQRAGEGVIFLLADPVAQRLGLGLDLGGDRVGDLADLDLALADAGPGGRADAPATGRSKRGRFADPLSLLP